MEPKQIEVPASMNMLVHDIDHIVVLFVEGKLTAWKATVYITAAFGMYAEGKYIEDPPKGSEGAGIKWV